MGVVYQLSTASCCKDYINTDGFAIGSGTYSKLLGFNVIGTSIAWALMFITLLENSSGEQVPLHLASPMPLIDIHKFALRIVFGKHMGSF